MSRCYICNKAIDSVKIDPRDLKPKPCLECEEIIFETLIYMDEEAMINSIESQLDEYNEELPGETDLGNS